jgi:hypothetical protein
MVVLNLVDHPIHCSLETLPDDVQSNILSRLAVQDLLRLGLTSKTLKTQVRFHSCHLLQTCMPLMVTSLIRHVDQHPRYTSALSESPSRPYNSFLASGVLVASFSSSTQLPDPQIPTMSKMACNPSRSNMATPRHTPPPPRPGQAYHRSRR